MKRNLTMTTAAAALLVGTVFAAAQGVQRQAPGSEGAMPDRGSTQQSAPEGKGKAQSQSAPEGKGKAQSQTQSAPEGKGKAQTQGQGQRETQGQSKDSQPPAKQTPAQRDTQPSQRDTQKGGAEGKSGAQTGAEGKSGAQTGAQTGGAQSGGVTLSTEQRTTIRNTVLQSSNAPRVSNVDFAVTVGTVVPRERVKLVAVPSTLVEIHPAWRGYMYFIVGERIIIVEPSSYKIVAVLVV